MSTFEDGEHITRDELYDRAKEHDIKGRSSMSKEALAEAVRRAEGRERVASRMDAFGRLAQASARGDFVMLPRLLEGQDRRLHVRQTLREDHQTRIASRSEDARVKFNKLAGSLFSFFRGTALLFYRDMPGEDTWMPTVLTLGDVHPDNFGVMPNEDNVPIFGVNDFDEAYYAPFTWDLARGAVGFMIGAEEEGGLGRKKQRKIASRFVRGYIAGIERFADRGREEQLEIRVDNAPKLIRKLIEKAQKKTRAEWLEKDYLDERKRGFRSDDELIPLSQRRDDFQAAIDDLVAQMTAEVPRRAGRMRVKDVAERRGQGTASLGLARYYVLIEGPAADGTDDLIIELKRARRSALTGLVPPSEFIDDSSGDRIAHAQSVQLVRGDIFFGAVELEGKSFMTRERAPFRDSVDLDDLSKKEWLKYADICGRSLAHAHALSDETGKLDYDIEPAILKAMEPRDLFVKDILRFADEAAERVRRDHAFFVEDHRDEAFGNLDLVFR